jgi:uncharacterized membrane protein
MEDLNSEINDSILELNTAKYGSDVRKAISKYEIMTYIKLLELEAEIKGKKAGRTDSQLSIIALITSIIALAVNIARVLLVQ